MEAEEEVLRPRPIGASQLWHYHPCPGATTRRRGLLERWRLPRAFFADGSINQNNSFTAQLRLLRPGLEPTAYSYRWPAIGVAR
jgi:hypothetical protein